MLNSDARYSEQPGSWLERLYVRPALAPAPFVSLRFESPRCLSLYAHPRIPDTNTGRDSAILRHQRDSSCQAYRCPGLIGASMVSAAGEASVEHRTNSRIARLFPMSPFAPFALTFLSRTGRSLFGSLRFPAFPYSASTAPTPGTAVRHQQVTCRGCASLRHRSCPGPRWFRNAGRQAFRRGYRGYRCLLEGTWITSRLCFSPSLACFLPSAFAQACAKLARMPSREAPVQVQGSLCDSPGHSR